jgi:hypothetical protein
LKHRVIPRDKKLLHVESELSKLPGSSGHFFCCSLSISESAEQATSGSLDSSISLLDVEDLQQVGTSSCECI